MPDAPPSQALAEAVVAALVTSGVRDVVLAPGSRSAPMAYALLAAEESGAIRLRVCVDERSAGFVALGLAVSTRRPVPVVVTSGSAVANLHPAVLEAAHQRVPLVVVSCDRPAALVRLGGSQTTEHRGIFGTDDGLAGGLSRPRATLEVHPLEPSPIPALVAGLLDAALAPVPGPVHLNLAFPDPLVPASLGPDPRLSDPLGPVPPVRSVRVDAPADDAGAAPAPASVQVSALDPARPAADGPAVAESIRTQRSPRTVVLAGDGAEPEPLEDLSAQWPVLAEPTVDLPGSLGSVPVLLDALGPDVERVVVLGRPTLSRQQSALLARADVEVVVVDPTGRPWIEPAGARHVPAIEPEGRAGPAWLARWRAAADAVSADLDAETDRVLEEGGPLEGWVAARLVSRAAAADGGLLVAGASMAIRQLDLAGVRGARVVSNRGLAGIDGTVSTALGHALATGGPVRVLLGDLTLQHDVGALVRGRLEAPVDLQLVVLADDGGSIFATLEHGRAELAAAHERVFATPQSLDLAALARAVGAGYVRAGDGASLAAALREHRGGLEILEVPLVRGDAARRRRARHERLVALARAAGRGS